MEAKDVRNLILSLLILMAGIRILTSISAVYMAQIQQTAQLDPALAGSVETIGTLIIVAIGGIVILLIPYWLHKRSQEKKAKEQQRPPPQRQPPRPQPQRQPPRYPSYPQYPYRR